MRLVRRSRLSRIALIASGAMLLGSAAFAQSVQVFDDAPSIEQLRSIFIPESQPGLSRTIVIQRPDMGAPPATVVERASTRVQPAPRTPVNAAPLQDAPAMQTASSAAAAPGPVAPKPVPASAGVVAFRVNFAFNSATLPASARPMINLIAQLMKESPQVKVRVEGHTDAVGSADYNASLSERRALSVGEYLVRQGVDPSRLAVVGKGMSEPLTRDPYDPANRRVQFVRVN
jgi:outer membrane protein OmpA-like peptidoglycan-associated protein